MSIGVKGIIVVAVGIYYLVAQTIQEHVHTSNLHGFFFLLHSMHHEFMLASVIVCLAMLFYKVGTLHKHTTRTTGRVEYQTAVWLNHLHHQSNDTGWRKKLSTTLTLLQRKLAKKIFIYLAKHIA